MAKQKHVNNPNFIRDRYEKFTRSGILHNGWIKDWTKGRGYVEDFESHIRAMMRRDIRQRVRSNRCLLDEGCTAWTGTRWNWLRDLCTALVGTGRKRIS